MVAANVDSHSISRQDRLLRHVPLGLVVLLTCVLARAFTGVPLSFIDVYSNLSTADTMTWGETVREAFHAGVEYRPLMTIATKLAYDTIGLDLHVYQIIVLLQFVALMAALLLWWRPVGP